MPIEPIPDDQNPGGADCTEMVTIPIAKGAGGLVPSFPPDDVEIVYVLFIDIISYSEFKSDKQRNLITQLQEIVKNTGQVRKARADRLLSLPSGDGMALVFYFDPLAPVRCAVEVTHAIRQGHLELALRMGIHGGPVFSIVDIGGNRNVTGAGINIAQRVMNCGDSGHILLSKVAADFLLQLSDYADYVKDLGEFEVKHGEKLQVYNFYSSEFGNSLRPVSQSQPSKIEAPSVGKLNTSIGVRRRISWAMALVIAAVIMFCIYKLGGVRSAPVEASIASLFDKPGPTASLTVSPDGHHLVYGAKRSGDWDLFMRDIGDGDFGASGEFGVSNAINLTPDNHYDDTQPSFSPDGNALAYRAEGVTRSQGAICILDLTGPKPRLEPLQVIGYNPSWSPDGKLIVYATKGVDRPEDRLLAKSKLLMITVATGEISPLFEGDAVQPNWSPQGHRIAYWANDDGGQRNIWTIDEAGRSPVRVTNDQYVDWNPVWAADGRHLYFLSDRSGAMELWRVAIEEKTGTLRGEPEQVSRLRDDTSQFSRCGFAVSSDDRNIYFSLEQISINTCKIEVKK